VLLGTIAAFAVGYLSIRWMLKIVAGKKLYQFAWYCWGMGGSVLLKEVFF
ncbi:MAG: undecaprenyl-diphosphate phosphatase, partial [Deltaproteobacteria bacterium]|nr:undecaprenyl-diphosphate phosphatase [Deltaproteobacteria bacterium]